MTFQDSVRDRRFATGAALLVALALAISFAPANAAAGGDGKPLAAPGGGKAVAAKKKKCKKKGNKSATVSKKKCKKKGGGEEAPPPPPAPAPLTAAEVINQVVLKAHQYCLADEFCRASGYYYAANLSDPTCVSRTTYIWLCFGWNEEDFDENGVVDTECRFLEVVSRTGLSGVTSYQDPTYAGDGWYCFSV